MKTNRVVRELSKVLIALMKYIETFALVTLFSIDAQAKIEGYCWPLSAALGEVIEFKVSGTGSSQVTFFRHNANSSGVTSIPMGSTTFVPTVQSTNSEAWRYGCGWSTSFTLSIPSDWPSGIYSAQLTDSVGAHFHITFVVKPAQPRCSRMAVVANVNTWLAYNGWPGDTNSKYQGRAHLSFLRPNPSASPIPGELHLTRAELWILGWLEDQSYQPDVYTDIDFHNQAVDLSQYKCIVLSTHPEYWSFQMRSNLDTFLASGGSLLYLGGNGIYEDAEYNSDKTGMIFLGGVDNSDRNLVLFRTLSPPGEQATLGVSSDGGCDVGCWCRGALRLWCNGTAPYLVRQASHPLFQGTGLSDGQTFGAIGLNTQCGNGGASGWEVDTKDTLKFDCSTTGGPELPSGLVVLATGENIMSNGEWVGADMTYYDHPGGGFVFSVGSITFGGSLVVDTKIQQIVRNALSAAWVSPLVFVDIANPNPGDGSQGNPYRSIADAINAAGPGATICIKGGDYPQAPLVFSKSATVRVTNGAAVIH